MGEAEVAHRSALNAGTEIGMTGMVNGPIWKIRSGDECTWVRRRAAHIWMSLLQELEAIGMTLCTSSPCTMTIWMIHSGRQGEHTLGMRSCEAVVLDRHASRIKQVR